MKPEGDLKFMVDIYATQAKYPNATEKVKCKKNGFDIETKPTGENCAIEGLEYVFDNSSFTIKPNKEYLCQYSLKAALEGTYITKLRIIEVDDNEKPIPDNPYTEKIFFVTVD